MLDKMPFAITALGMIGGVFVAILFGVNEDFFKNKIDSGLSNNEKLMQIEDTQEREAKLEAEASKNWRYYQRYHFHATGLGAMALSVLLLSRHIKAGKKILLASRFAVSLGGLLYPFIWLFAAIYGPSMGRHEAKEAFAIFGYMGGLFLLGLILILYSLIRYPLKALPDE